jgi:Macrocin-O-methyltransferase (TylF)
MHGGSQAHSRRRHIDRFFGVRQSRFPVTNQSILYPSNPVNSYLSQRPLLDNRSIMPMKPTTTTHTPWWGKRPDTPSSAGRKSFHKLVMTLVCLGLVILSLRLPVSLSAGDRSSSRTIKVAPNRERYSTCAETTFSRRSLEEDELYSKAWNATISFVKSRNLTFLKQDTLDFHRQMLSEIERMGTPGMIFECGVAKGGSAIAFTSYKHPQRCLHLFDTFDGIPEPSEKDGPDVLERYKVIQQDKLNCRQGAESCNRDYYGNINDLLQYDMAQFESAGYKHSNHSVFFHKGLFDDTVWPGGPIALAHLVCIWRGVM